MKKPRVRKVGSIRAAAQKWLGLPVGLNDEEFWRQMFGSQSSAGVTVDDQRILTLSTVWACTRLISQAVGTLPLSIYEQLPVGRRRAPAHPLGRIIHLQPSPEATAAVYWESVVAAMLLRGSAHSEKLMIGDRLVGLRFLAPMRLTITRMTDGHKRWLYTDDNGRQREIPGERIWTIPGFSLDGKNGVSVIRYGVNVFGSALAADHAAASTFEKGLMPTVALSYPKILNPKQRDEARETLKQLGGAVNAGNPVVLEAETTITTIGINPDDAQLLESRQFSVEEVCRWFGVDPTMVGHGEKTSNWGTGLEQKLIGFLTFTLRPVLHRIEQQIRKDLFRPGEQERFYAKYSVEGLLRADSAGRAAFFGVMVDKGILTRDEVRELEDREPMGGNAARLTVQTAMGMLDDIGTTTPDRQARAALIEWLREGDDPAPSEQ